MREIAVAMFVSSLAAPVVAVADSGWYMGAGVGVSNVDIKDSDVHVTNVTSSSLSKDEDGTAYRVFVGYQINPSFAMEASSLDLGTASGRRTVTAPVSGTATGRLRTSGANIDLVAMLPITDQFSVLARLGAYASHATDSRSTTGAIMLNGSSDVTESTTQLHYGLGVQYVLDPTWGIRGEWERTKVAWYNNDKPTVATFSAGVVFKF